MSGIPASDSLSVKLTSIAITFQLRTPVMYPQNKLCTPTLLGQWGFIISSPMGQGTPLIIVRFAVRIPVQGSPKLQEGTYSCSNPGVPIVTRTSRPPLDTWHSSSSFLAPRKGLSLSHPCHSLHHLVLPQHLWDRCPRHETLNL